MLVMPCFLSITEICPSFVPIPPREPNVILSAKSPVQTQETSCTSGKAAGIMLLPKAVPTSH